MKNQFIVVLIIVCLIGCRKEPQFSTATFQTRNGWGYTIAINKKVVIKQSIIPTVVGNQSFVTKKEALKTAAVVLRKLKRFGNPTLTKNEIDSLQITYQHE
ncbi:DUF4907 domain-containing protein [Flavobacterium stagni]|uniref:DUF4907 domain-containing protein n=1 Tax=Flavobacterium stagni TaxID=2506421 RepID=A0A4Q1KAB8_9FLAO|nr:DUF4907 domain-containing protein [Flavobacterium stagni]RXR22990.1 DUF4907 domain-containing protein [Flavobacterium stagni]